VLYRTYNNTAASTQCAPGQSVQAVSEEEW
jgi:hypothetical protein